MSAIESFYKAMRKLSWTWSSFWKEADITEIHDSAFAYVSELQARIEELEEKLKEANEQR